MTRIAFSIDPVVLRRHAEALHAMPAPRRRLVSPRMIVFGVAIAAGLASAFLAHRLVNQAGVGFAIDGSQTLRGLLQTEGQTH